MVTKIILSAALCVCTLAPAANAIGLGSAGLNGLRASNEANEGSGRYPSATGRARYLRNFHGGWSSWNSVPTGYNTSGPMNTGD